MCACKKIAKLFNIKAYEYLPCECQTFKIKGKSADSSDFGESIDKDEAHAPDYGCGDRQFVRRPARLNILAKYEITESEYEAICDELESKLRVGCCELCA